ncbi:MAG: glycosyltransferase family 2 protein [Bacteroidales bacterium]
MQLFVTIPAINELEFIPGVLADLAKQEYRDFTLLVCVNQPEEWWNDESKRDICKNNVATLDYVKSFCEMHNISLILQDKCSRGNGWTERQGGVGWARKTLMDAVEAIADDDDVIVSLDADTRVETNYLAEIAKQFAVFQKASAMALPYFHRLQGDDDHKKSMLRYEIYLRCYAINLLRIKHPFAYTPIGSAMAARVSAYRKIRGLTATSSGEDFYFMMKLRKTGIIIPFCDTRVYPSSRKSHRVIFGTGPTVALGAPGQVERYPIYHPFLFNKIEDACRAFGEIFITANLKAVERALMVFPDLEHEKLLRNHPQLIRFIHACYMKADAFAIYKFVRSNQPADVSDMESVSALLKALQLPLDCLSFNEVSDTVHISIPLNVTECRVQDDNSGHLHYNVLHNLSVEQLKSLRKLLMETEEKMLKKKYNDYFALHNDLKHPIWKYMS